MVSFMFACKDCGFAIEYKGLCPDCSCARVAAEERRVAEIGRIAMQIWSSPAMQKAHPADREAMAMNIAKVVVDA